MKFKKGDQIEMISGKDKGKRGSVIRIFPTSGQISVEGINIRKKHIRSRKEGEKGQRVEFPASFFAGKAMLVCPHSGKLTRIGFRREGNERVRVSKKAGKVIS